MQLLRASFLVVLISITLLGSCAAPPVGAPCADAPERCVVEASSGSFALGRRDVDILFVIDNSGSMMPKQQALAQNIRKFIQRIDKSGANYHVAVTTTEAGACAGNSGADGLLQNTPCTQRAFDGAGSGAEACRQICPDPSFLPRDGARYIAKIDGVSNVPPALVNGEDDGPRRAFQCLALVGDKGCHLESPLQAARRAIERAQQPGDPNHGFLRPNSTLAIIFITDEDDCSIEGAHRAMFNQEAESCQFGTAAQPACFHGDMRCLAASVRCAEPLSEVGQKSGCKLVEQGYLRPVVDYVDYFRQLRPGQVIVSGIWTRPGLMDGGRLVIRNNGNGPNTKYLMRGTEGDAGCVHRADPKFYGFAQVRLSAFASGLKSAGAALKSVSEIDLCDTDGYEAALDRLAGEIIPAPCLPQRPALRGDGVPLCTVQYTYPDPQHLSETDRRLLTEEMEKTETPLPRCGDACCAAFSTSKSGLADDPQVRAACAGEAAHACYCASANEPACKGKPVLGVWRKDQGAPPAGTRLFAQCATPVTP